MSRAYLALLFVSALSAQSQSDFLDKAPPDVDDALRARVTKFYQAHVDKKFRQADEFVAEDTKDFYYESNKPAYLAFEVGKILYSDNFTNAKVIVTCKMQVPMPGFGDTPVTVPIPSTWKVEKGQWYWYVDQSRGRATPWGVMKPAQGQPSARAMPSLAAAPNIETLWKSVGADKNVVQFNAKTASSDQVMISSKLPGAVSLQLTVPRTPGLEVVLDRSELKAGEQAKITFHFEPQENPVSKTIEVRVTVMPTNQVIPITVAIR